MNIKFHLRGDGQTSKFFQVEDRFSYKAVSHHVFSISGQQLLRSSAGTLKAGIKSRLSRYGQPKTNWYGVGKLKIINLFCWYYKWACISVHTNNLLQLLTPKTFTRGTRVPHHLTLYLASRRYFQKSTPTTPPKQNPIKSGCVRRKSGLTEVVDFLISLNFMFCGMEDWLQLHTRHNCQYS